MRKTSLDAAYRLAKERYGEHGVDTDAALQQLSAVSISLHCWQGDDVRGFENLGQSLDGGLAITGNYAGKARCPEELRADLDKALSLIPGKHRVNLHAFYAETGGKKVDRNELEPEHFANWMTWAAERKLGLDFNPTCFSHPKAADGFTLSHADRRIRRFWIEHCIACRRIGSAMGKALRNPCITNIWIPDGMKDTPADRRGPRERLAESLDEIFKTPIEFNLDAIEGKLFGIGSESYVVGSYDFYLAYAVRHRKLLTLDTGHFHPTESLADKISAVLTQLDEILLHVSRGVRWDSDHVVTLTDELEAVAQEIVWNGYLRRVHIALDYFDASINRIAAWVIGARNVLKALLLAMLTPIGRIRAAERAGDYTSRLAWLEEAKTLPFGAVWDYYCASRSVPIGHAWLAEVKAYEKNVLSKRQ